MIEPWQKSRTPELKKLLDQFNAHTPSNPDDDLDLSGNEFLSATDEESRELIAKIHDAGEVALFDHAGRKQGQTRAALVRAGHCVSVVGDPNDEDDATKTTIQLHTNHGAITLVSPLVGR
jgi:hypothetical protein